MSLNDDWEQATTITQTPSAAAAPSQAQLQQEFAGTKPTPTPSMGDVAMNAVPKGLAALLNQPMTIASLIMHGIANLPGAGHLTGLQEAAKNPDLNANVFAEAGTQMGLIDPSKNPQTGPQRIVDTAIETAINLAGTAAGGVAAAARGAVVGAVSGGAAQTTKELTGSDLLAIAVGAGSPLAIKALTDSSKRILLNPTHKETLRQAQADGFVVEPSQVREPSSIRESIAGKPSIAQAGSMKNQPVANRIVAEDLGLPGDTALSKPLLESLKQKIDEPYRMVEQLRASATGTDMEYFKRYHSISLLDELKQARQDSNSLWRSYWAKPDEGVKKAAIAASAEAKSIEADIDMVAKATGKPELLDQLKGARMLYAKINDVEDVLNFGSGNVSMPKLAKMLQEGAPLTGGLERVARFARAFPRVAREVEAVPPAGVSATNIMAGTAMGMEGAVTTGSPLGLAAAGLPAFRGPAREKVLSQGYQAGLLTEPPPPTSVGTALGRSTVVGSTVEEEQKP